MKKINLLSIFLFLLTLCVTFFGAGCEKDKLDYYRASIIGQWEWLYTSGGFAGTVYPKEDEKVTWEFTEDSIAIRRVNNKIILQTDFSISKDTININDLENGSFLFSIKHDTLILNQYTVGVPSFISFSKRIK